MCTQLLCHCLRHFLVSSSAYIAWWGLTESSTPPSSGVLNFPYQNYILMTSTSPTNLPPAVTQQRTPLSRSYDRRESYQSVFEPGSVDYTQLLGHTAGGRGHPQLFAFMHGRALASSGPDCSTDGWKDNSVIANWHRGPEPHFAPCTFRSRII